MCELVVKGEMIADRAKVREAPLRCCGAIRNGQLISSAATTPKPQRHRAQDKEGDGKAGEVEIARD